MDLINGRRGESSQVLISPGAADALSDHSHLEALRQFDNPNVLQRGCV